VPQPLIMEMSFPTVSSRKLSNPVTTGTGIFASFDDVFLSA